MLPEPDQPYTEAEAEMEKNCVLFPAWYVEEVVADGYAGVFLPLENWEIYLRLYDKKKSTAPYSMREETAEKLRKKRYYDLHRAREIKKSKERYYRNKRERAEEKRG